MLSGDRFWLPIQLAAGDAPALQFRTADKKLSSRVYTELLKVRTMITIKRLHSILIMVQYPNMAALDSLRDKMDPIIEKVMGPEDQRRATAVKRLDIREILGTKTMREITLK